MGSPSHQAADHVAQLLGGHRGGVLGRAEAVASSSAVHDVRPGARDELGLAPLRLRPPLPPPNRVVLRWAAARRARITPEQAGLPVTGGRRVPAKHAWLRDLGADYTDPAALAALADAPVDVALNLAAGSLEAALATVRPGGVLIALGVGADRIRPAAKAAGVRFAVTHVHSALVPTVSQVFDLTQAADAHRAIEAGHTQGKIVLRA